MKPSEAQVHEAASRFGRFLAPPLQRARGRARVKLSLAEGGATRLAGLFQEGCVKVRLPYPETKGSVDALIINTAGGLTGGDALSMEVILGEGACATVTTPACEKLYRSTAGEASIEQRLQVGRGARLDWIPQETILFDRARLRRRLDVQLEADAEITLAEGILFGRAAMGETLKSGSLSDFWTIRLEGRLLYADAVRISAPFDKSMACTTTLGGNVAMASLVHVGHGLESKRDGLRAGSSHLGCAAGATVMGDILVARIVAPTGHTLRGALIAALGILRNGRPLPRNWLC